MQFAQAQGISDEDIQSYLQDNGLAVIKTAEEIRKEDIQEFKDNQYSRTSRGTKNEILNQHQGYMNVALDAFKNAQTPEEKAQIMNLVQTMPRSAASVDSFDTKMQVWLNRLETVIGSERLQQSMEVFSIKTDLQHEALAQQIDNSTDYAVKATRQAADQTVQLVNEHTDEVGANVKQHVTNTGNNVVRRVSAKIDDATSDITDSIYHSVSDLQITLVGDYDQLVYDDEGNLDHYEEEVGGALGAAIKDVKSHVSAEHTTTRGHVTNEADRVNAHTDKVARYTQMLQSARAEITEILQECDLDDDDVRALGNEATLILGSTKLSSYQKSQLLESMAKQINDVSYISDNDLKRITKARVMIENGQTPPCQIWYIDYDKIPLE